MRQAQTQPGLLRLLYEIRVKSSLILFVRCVLTGISVVEIFVVVFIVYKA